MSDNEANAGAFSRKRERPVLDVPARITVRSAVFSIEYVYGVYNRSRVEHRACVTEVFSGLEVSKREALYY